MIDPQPMTAFDMMLAQMREVAAEENVRAGLHRVPRLPELAPKATGRRPIPIKVVPSAEAVPLSSRRTKRAKAKVVEQRRHTVVQMLSQGLSQRQISDRLGISIRLVQDDCVRLRKIGVIA